ncbi:MAG: hypothetical protein LUD81_00565 [Clostridiales bacterium]|nr:hypothetical protein [Clostridiales bacterium]
MSWVKNRNKNKIKTVEKADNPPQNIQKPEKALFGSSPKIGKSPEKLSRDEIWSRIKLQIVLFAPSMTYLAELPVEYRKGKAAVLCSGAVIYIYDEVWKLPEEDILYMVLKEFTQVLMGFRVKKDIKIVELRISEKTARRELGMITAKAENMLCDIALMECSEYVGVNPSIVKPSKNMLRRIYESFGPYTGKNGSYIKYADDEEALSYFMSEWGCTIVGETMKMLAEGYKFIRGSVKKEFINIHFSINSAKSKKPQKNIELTSTPKGYFLIDIPAEEFEQTAGNIKSNDTETSEEQSEDSGGNSKEQPEQSESGGSQSNSPNKNSGRTDSQTEDLKNGSSAPNGERGEKDRGENRDSSKGWAEASDNMAGENSVEFASEYLFKLNEENMSMSNEAYKDIISNSKKYLDKLFTDGDARSFGELVEENYRDLYKVSSLWWKKAQSMIKSYVPDVNSSYRRPNKKFAMSEFILPSQCESSENFEVDRLRVFLDSSGSMKPHEFKLFKSIIKSTQKYFPRDTLAYEFNTAVTPMKCVNGKIFGAPKHTGGTDIKCVTEFIFGRQNRAKTLNIVVTDGGFYWEDFITYMKQKDRMSKFLFILTSGRYYSEAARAADNVGTKRLKTIYIDTDSGREGESLSWRC